MKKKILSIIIITLIYSQAYSQKHEVKLGYGIDINNSGDLKTPSMQYHYTYKINNLLNITSMYSMGNAFSKENTSKNFKIQNSHSFTLGVKLKPLHEINKRFSFDVSYLRRKTSSASAYFSTYFPSGNSISYFDVLNGLSYNIDLVLFEREKIKIGVNSMMFTSLNLRYLR